MRFYDELGQCVDFGTLSVEDLNLVVREAVDMMRREIEVLDSLAYDRLTKVALAELNDSAINFTNVYFRFGVAPLGKSE